MKLKRFTVWIMILGLLACLAGCGAASKTDAGMDSEGYKYGSSSSVYDAGMPNESVAEAPAAPQAQSYQKLVRRMTLEAETADMDTLMAALKAQTAALGGYVQNQSVRNGGSSANRHYRYADLTIRIPADRMGEFIDHVKDNTNITSYQESADDITLSYVATESRVKALQTEQERLLELLAQAETMSDLLQIEERLTQVRTELEQVTSQMRLYDNLVDYGTVSLTIREVQEFTVVDEETLWQRISSGFMQSLKSLGSFFKEAFVWFVVSLPYWILIGAAIALVVFVIKLSSKKKQKKSFPGQPSEESK